MDTENTETSAGFAALALDPRLQAAVAQLGYTTPTHIQQEAIPLLLAERDLLGLAATGTGKTAAFALPLLHRLAALPRAESPRALVLVPTRELARQAGGVLRDLGNALGLTVQEVYGGAPMRTQLRALKHGVDVVVATPGRAQDHLTRGSLSLESLAVVVLDEADAMLDMGFQEDIEAILAHAPAARQTALFSATLPDRLRAIVAATLRDPATVRITAQVQAPPRIEERAYLVARHHKLPALARILAFEDPEAALIFCQTREEVEAVYRALSEDGHRIEPLHGGLGQAERDRVIHRLHSGAVSLVVATDVAARGLDVDRLSHVINYDLPTSPEAYVHRIGRTGRAGREGVALTFVTPGQVRFMEAIERHTRRPLERARVPSVAQLRMAQLAGLTDRLREVDRSDAEPLHAFIASLVDDMSPLDVATAALQILLDAERSGAEDVDIPEAALPTRRPPAPKRRRGEGARPMTTLFVGIGGRGRLRPNDLVGAIAGESGLPGHAIGNIQILPHFSLVDVPADAADAVIEALRRTTLRGKKVKVRRDQATL